MSPVLSFDILALINLISLENPKTRISSRSLLWSLIPTSRSIENIYLPLSNLHGANSRLATSKKRFVRLLKSRLDVINYIRKLTYEVCHKAHDNEDDHLLSPTLSNFLPTVSRLNCLTITASQRDWSNLTRPWHLRAFALYDFLPLITSTSHI